MCRGDAACVELSVYFFSVTVQEAYTEVLPWRLWCAKNSSLRETSQILDCEVPWFASVVTVSRKASLKLLFSWLFVSKDFKKLAVSELLSVVSLQEYRSQIFYIRDL